MIMIQGEVMSESILDVVRDVLVKVRNVDPEQVIPEALLVDDLGADSLDAIEIIIALESHYGKELDSEDVENLKTVGDVVTLVETIVN